MLSNQTIIVYNKVADFSLMWCMQLAAHVKKPPYIPFFEVCTYDLVARYFGVTEKRVKNAYNNARHVFENDCAMLTGRDILPVAIESKNMGRSYGYSMTFPNGVIASVSFGANMVFNGRALLQFAVILQNESKVARTISKMLWEMIFGSPTYALYGTKSSFSSSTVKRVRPWFLYDEFDKDTSQTEENNDDMQSVNVVIEPGSNAMVNITVKNT